MKSKSMRFLPTIYKIWMLRYVTLPEDIGRAFAKGSGQEKYIPVVAIKHSRRARTTLVPPGGSRYRLQFNATLRKAARADVGDVVSVELRLDRATRGVPLPPELRAAPERAKSFPADGARDSPATPAPHPSRKVAGCPPKTSRTFLRNFRRKSPPQPPTAPLATPLTLALRYGLSYSPPKRRP